MAPASSSDLTQVAALFEACIEQIRSKPVAMGSLDKKAEEWLKDARVEVMKEIERHFSNLSKNADDPSLTPMWATSPSIPLTIFPPRHSRRLDPYVPSFEKEFNHLMKQCGFTATVESAIFEGCDQDTLYRIDIYFPAGSTSRSSTSHFMKCFDSLPQFSAAVLKITEGVEKPVPPPDGSSTPEKHSSPRLATKGTRKSRRSAPKNMSGRRQSVNIVRDASSKHGLSNARRTSKRLRSSASVLDTPEENADTPRRSKRLRGL